MRIHPARFFAICFFAMRFFEVREQIYIILNRHP